MTEAKQAQLRKAMADLATIHAAPMLHERRIEDRMADEAVDAERLLEDAAQIVKAKLLKAGITSGCCDVEVGAELDDPADIHLSAYIRLPRLSGLRGDDGHDLLVELADTLRLMADVYEAQARKSGRRSA